MRHYARQSPPVDLSEHKFRAAEWSLPVLLTWLPPDVIVWTLGLLLVEGKLLVVGDTPGLVCTGVLGLLSLLRPLNWVAPLIPLLPQKHLEFIESPVPLLAGIVDARETGSIYTNHHYRSPSEESMRRHGGKAPTQLDGTRGNVNDHARNRAWNFLKHINDSETGSMTAVLDISQRELFIARCNEEKVHTLVMPGANALRDKLEEVWHSSGIEMDPSSGTGKAAPKWSKGIYECTHKQREFSAEVREHVHNHLQVVLAKAESVWQSKQARRQNDVAGAPPGILGTSACNEMDGIPLSVDDSDSDDSDFEEDSFQQGSYAALSQDTVDNEDSSEEEGSFSPGFKAAVVRRGSRTDKQESMSSKLLSYYGFKRENEAESGVIALSNIDLPNCVSEARLTLTLTLILILILTRTLTLILTLTLTLTQLT